MARDFGSLLSWHPLCAGYSIGKGWRLNVKLFDLCRDFGYS